MLSKIRRIDETLRKNYKELTVIIYKQEKQIQFLETNALHLSMFYVASQLIIFLSSNSKLSAYRCRDWWKLFVVSLSIAVIFGVNLATTIVKYVRTKYEQDRNFIDQEEYYYQMACPARDGDGSTTMVSDVYREVKPDNFGVYMRYVHIGVTVLALLGFTGVVLHTCRSSVCAV